MSRPAWFERALLTPVEVGECQVEGHGFVSVIGARAPGPLSYWCTGVPPTVGGGITSLRCWPRNGRCWPRPVRSRRQRPPPGLRTRRMGSLGSSRGPGSSFLDADPDRTQHGRLRRPSRGGPLRPATDRHRRHRSPVRPLTVEKKRARTRRAAVPVRNYSSRDQIMARFRTVPPNATPAADYVAQHVASTSIRHSAAGWSWKSDPKIFASAEMTPEMLARILGRLALIRAEQDRCRRRSAGRSSPV